VTPSRRFEKALLIGLDCAVPGRWRRFAEAGLLPVGQRLLADGCFAAECLPAMPTLTTTNWATIATGAWPGTHGITDFNPYRLGDGIDDSLQGFDARDVRAEFVWEAAVRAGLDSIVVNWPGSWPPRPAPAEAPREAPVERAGEGAGGRPADAVTPGRLTLAGGAGIELNEWRIGLPGMDRRVALAAEQRFSTRDEPRAQRVALPPGGEPFELPLAFRFAYDEVRSAVTLVCRVVARGDRPGVRFSLPGREEALAELAAGEWSERLELPLAVDGATVPAVFRLKLLELEPGAGLFRLYVTDICRQTWLEQPAGVLGDAARFAGLPTPGVGWDSFGLGCIDLDTFVELTAMATTWLADVCAALIEERPWHLFCTHFHAIDSFYHLCSAKLDESVTLDAEERRHYEAAEIAVYRQLDDAIGRLLVAVDAPALTVLVSDHGATPAGPPLPLRRILAGAGLLTAEDRGGHDLAGIDWQHTLAVPQGSCYVRLNLEGREPLGVVAPGSFEQVRDRVLRALLDFRDPATGVCPFSLVTRKEDAVALGLFGDGVGDVVYAVHPEYCDEHGQMLPQATRAAGSWGMPALCLAGAVGPRSALSAGAAANPADTPGLALEAPGRTLQTPISLTDVAPTVCRALGIGPPLQADGAAVPELLPVDL
jgi:predicted AlkP superfamily phosphohydrolase/phosphomutase